MILTSSQNKRLVVTLTRYLFGSTSSSTVTSVVVSSGNGSGGSSSKSMQTSVMVPTAVLRCRLA